MSMLLPALCDALRVKSVRFSLEYRDDVPTCIATPPAGVTKDMLGALRRYKPEIVRALRQAERAAVVELFPCTRCGSDVVLEAAELCATCHQMQGRIVSMDPGSAAESAYLKALTSVEQLSPTVPTSVNSSHMSLRGQLGTVGTVYRGNASCARA